MQYLFLVPFFFLTSSCAFELCGAEPQSLLESWYGEVHTIEPQISTDSCCMFVVGKEKKTKEIYKVLRAKRDKSHKRSKRLRDYVTKYKVTYPRLYAKLTESEPLGKSHRYIVDSKISKAIANGRVVLKGGFGKDEQRGRDFLLYLNKAISLGVPLTEEYINSLKDSLLPGAAGEAD